MRRLQYGVAASLDGFIAGPNGEVDWIRMDSEIDFAAVWARYDTLVMGRKTFEAGIRTLGESAFAGRRVFVCSKRLKPEDCPGVTIVPEISRAWIRSVKDEPGKDIWLMGGGTVFRALLDLGEVDSVEVMIVPVLLGSGTPVMPPPYRPTMLRMTSHRVYTSGMISASYEISRE